MLISSNFTQNVFIIIYRVRRVFGHFISKMNVIGERPHIEKSVCNCEVKLVLRAPWSNCHQGKHVMFRAARSNCYEKTSRHTEINC